MLKYVKITNKYQKKIKDYGNGLIILTNFITPTEEKELIETINNNEWNQQLSRKVQHYGYIYDYKTRCIKEEDFLGKLPKWLRKYRKKIMKSDYYTLKPNQVIINRYLQGEGISAHIDVPKLFDSEICSLSLGSHCVMIFKNNKTNEKIEIVLKPRTLLIFKDSARYDFTHEIPKRKSDNINGIKIKRCTRYSITFRKMITT